MSTHTEFAISIQKTLVEFEFNENSALFSDGQKTIIEYLKTAENNEITRFTNEFWTSKQRQANPLHEVSYRACFKPQLPKFFIELLTQPDDIVYDPFAGRGTTAIESALLSRNVISNDINPLSVILCKPRLFIPDVKCLQKRLEEIVLFDDIKSDIDLLMFFNEKTLTEILSIRKYLADREKNNALDDTDKWIRMVSTNRLTGHSKGFFSVYTLPPNQAVSPEKQKKINEKKNQTPEYKDTKKIILKKSRELIKDLTSDQIAQLKAVGEKALFLNKDARQTDDIPDETVQLTVTSPPFLDIVQYTKDNWLRCWFNGINAEEIEKKITMAKKIEDWCDVMSDVFRELFRITKHGGYVAFEVGEVRKGSIKLDEYIVDIGIKYGFVCEGVMINEQSFTKTANIWGIDNNVKGTNSNRIVFFRKPDNNTSFSLITQEDPSLCSG
jgi:hypothetical protein